MRSIAYAMRENTLNMRSVVCRHYVQPHPNSNLFWSVISFLLILGVTPLLSKGNSGLSLEQRVTCRRAIERVYHEHRLWPAENSRPRPPFEEAVPESVIRKKVEEDMRSVGCDRSDEGSSD